MFLSMVMVTLTFFKTKYIFPIVALQENFQKNAYGLLHLGEIAGQDAVSAVAKLEEDNELKPAMFRGAENLVPPDVKTLFSWVLFLAG